MGHRYLFHERVTTFTVIVQSVWMESFADKKKVEKLNTASFFTIKLT